LTIIDCKTVSCISEEYSTFLSLSLSLSISLSMYLSIYLFLCLSRSDFRSVSSGRRLRRGIQTRILGRIVESIRRLRMRRASSIKLIESAAARALSMPCACQRSRFRDACVVEIARTLLSDDHPSSPPPSVILIAELGARYVFLAGIETDGVAPKWRPCRADRDV